MSVRVTPEAAADLEDIFRWYSDRNATIALEFLNALAEVLHRIDEYPASGTEVHLEVRRVPLRRFPYCVFYARDSAGPVVLGCFHAHRDPEIWARRRRG